MRGGTDRRRYWCRKGGEDGSTFVEDELLGEGVTCGLVAPAPSSLENVFPQFVCALAPQPPAASWGGDSSVVFMECQSCNEGVSSQSPCEAKLLIKTWSCRGWLYFAMCIGKMTSYLQVKGGRDERAGEEERPGEAVPLRP